MQWSCSHGLLRAAPVGQPILLLLGIRKPCDEIAERIALPNAPSPDEPSQLPLVLRAYREFNSPLTFRLHRNVFLLNPNLSRLSIKLQMSALMVWSSVRRVKPGKVEPCLGSLAVLADAFALSLSELLKGL